MSNITMPREALALVSAARTDLARCKPGSTAYALTEAKLFRAIDALAALSAAAEQTCPTCGLRDISFSRTCHNSACADYAKDITVFEGWKGAYTNPAPAVPDAAKPETHPDLPECKHNAHGWEPETQGERAEQMDAHLKALMRYTEAFYGSAIEHGMKAGPVADCVAHVERAARALHAAALLSAGPARAEPLTPEIIDRAGREWWAQTRHTNGPRVLKEYAGEAVMREVYETARIILEAYHGIGKDQAS